jgi:hypothetical protein
VGGDADAGAAHDSERHQPAALRHAERDHGGQEEGDPQRGAARRPHAGLKIVGLSLPSKSKQTALIDGAPAQAAAELVRRLRDEARVL